MTPPALDGGECLTGDPEVMFPDPRNPGKVNQAKAVCASCDVRARCLEWAMSTGERHGVWGGLSEEERRDLAAPQTAATAA